MKALALLFLCSAALAQPEERNPKWTYVLQNEDMGYIYLLPDHTDRCGGELLDAFAEDKFGKLLHGCYEIDRDNDVIILPDGAAFGVVIPFEMFKPIQDA